MLAGSGIRSQRSCCWFNGLVRNLRLIFFEDWLCRLRCGNVERMADERRSWLRKRVETAMVKGLTRAYSSVRVDPAKFLMQLRTAYRMPISGYHGVYSLDIGEVDAVAQSVIRSGMKVAAVEGAGLGMGGLLTIVPDLGILSAITMRTIEKLSLVYGFEFNTDDEIAELWVAAASAAGVDISRDLLEKEVLNKFVPRVIERIAVQASKEVVEKWAGRVIPLASAAIGAGLNYWFVRAWGERGKAHFRERYLAVRPARLALMPVSTASNILPDLLPPSTKS
jgi:EcsC protein family